MVCSTLLSRKPLIDAPSDMSESVEDVEAVFGHGMNSVGEYMPHVDFEICGEHASGSVTCLIDRARAEDVGVGGSELKEEHGHCRSPCQHPKS